jgi:hypothetical protein
MGLVGSLHPKALRVMKEQLDVDAALVAVCLEGFQHGVEADSIPVFEAVCQCLLGRPPVGEPGTLEGGYSIEKVRCRIP